MEFDKTSWSCSWNGDHNCTQNSTRVTSCLSKTGLCMVISSQISFKFEGKVVYDLLCIPLLVFLGSVLSAVQDFRSILSEQ